MRREKYGKKMLLRATAMLRTLEKRWESEKGTFSETMCTEVCGVGKWERKRAKNVEKMKTAYIRRKEELREMRGDRRKRDDYVK